MGKGQEKPGGCSPFGFILKLLSAPPSPGEGQPGQVESIASGSDAVELPYQMVGSLLTAAERSFYGVLLTLTPDVTVHAKVRLSDLVKVTSEATSWRSSQNRINSKHVDFVLCRKDTLRPLLVIELDDSTHNKPARQERDAFVDALCEKVGLPILHVKAQKAYDPKALSVSIKNALA